MRLITRERIAKHAGILSIILIGPTCDNSTALRVGPPAIVEVVAGQDQTETVGRPLTESLSARVLDSRQNPVPRYPVAFKVTSGGGSISPGQSVTGDDGIAEAAWTLGTSITEPQRSEAQIVDSRTGERLLFAEFRATATVGAPTRLGFVTPPSTTATNGEALSSQPVVQLQDEYGNVVKKADVVIQITQLAGSGAGTAQILNDTTKTDANGIATFTGTQVNGPVGDGYRLGFSTAGAATLSSDPISIRRGRPYALAIRIRADGATRGSVFAVQPVIQVVDAGGNGTPAGECVNAHINPGGTLTGITQLSSTGDTYSFTNLGVDALTSPGEYKLTYNVGCCAPTGTILPVEQTIEVR